MSFFCFYRPKKNTSFQRLTVSLYLDIFGHTFKTNVWTDKKKNLLNQELILFLSNSVGMK